MRRLLAFLLAVMISTPSLAADNTVVLTPGSGVTMRTQDVGSGVQSPYNILGNVSGTSIYGTAGSSNAAVLSVQGIASGTALPASQSGTWTVGLSAAQTLATVTTVGTVSAVTTLGSITGAVSLPTGASSAANQTTAIAGIGAIGDSAWTSGNGSLIAIGKAIVGAVQGDVPSVTAPLNAATAVATKSLITGCQYLSSLPTYTNTQQGSCTFDVNGRVLASLASAAPIAPATATATKSNVTGSQYNSTQATFTDGQQGAFQISSRGAILIATGADTPSFRSIAGATGGGTISSAIAPATPAGVNLKASAGTVLKVFATTIQSTPVYVKLYNSSSAPTCGSGTPVARFMVPSAATAANGAGTNIDLGDIGAAFGTGIGYCVTGALADNDTTAITATNTLVNIVWN